MKAPHSGTTIHGLPRIRRFTDLANHVGVQQNRLWLMLSGADHWYVRFQVPKRSGGTRNISHPRPALKSVQYWILENILRTLRTTSSSYGFERGSRIRAHAAQHVGASAILALDIRDFFGSVSVARVTTVFRVAGYNRKVASVLARLCTFRGTLPQGSPTSPKLANLTCYRMDTRLAALSDARQIVYTRYADDMSFSAKSPVPLIKTKNLIVNIIRECGFRVNGKKTRLLGSRGALLVTGLVVGETDVGIGRERLRMLRAQIHRAGLAQDHHALASVQGWLDFVADADPMRYTMLKGYIARLIAGSHITSLGGLRLRA
jgi:RNA-directed DNA polymerase